ncbi:tumor necrosis factor ligand superfamily member 11 [Betta splendens]|uniref:Tumor necrosis factor ligand superfamily member 11 n=1 Tax=Betta splendens TaxID=158456 RepID=A0A6P7LFR3_BETSP|nr:tumor necrosis factor ligand superfamily member 11 [Betta splendens]
MAATHSEYRGYLRSSVDVESGPHRFQPAQSSESPYRPLLFGTLAVMGLLQVASSVAILLHLTGYLQEVDLSTVSRRPIEEAQTEPVLNALKDKRNKNKGCKTPKESLASAHLPILVREISKKGEPRVVTIEWDAERGSLHRTAYQKGKLLLTEPGYYYVYAKTCFRYYNLNGAGGEQLDVSNAQLIQYVYYESVKNNKAILLMKTGSTMRWNNTTYNMYCAQQGRGVRLEDGDALYVNVSNAWMLDPEGEGTYFGAIKLGN